MKKHKLSVAIAVATLVLVGGVVIAGRDARPKGPEVLVDAASVKKSTAAIGDVTTETCALTNSAPGISNVSMSGACTGIMSTAFGCKANDDDLYLSIKVPMDAVRTLYLSVNVESYKNTPGDYDGTEASLQLGGPSGWSYWQSRSFPVHVNKDLSIDFVPARLGYVPGTASTGIVTISGHAACQPT